MGESGTGVKGLEEEIFVKKERGGLMRCVEREKGERGARRVNSCSC